MYASGGQPLLNKGFTLIELLAVIVILAIIALIATPIILNTIKDSKEKSVMISVQNYLKAVEVAVMNKDLDKEAKNLNGYYNIESQGKLIRHEQYQENTINIEYNGQGLTSGRIKIENLKITEIKKGRIDNWDIDWKEGETLKLKEHKEEIKVTLLTGSNFNVKIKQLANPDNESIKYNTTDNTITSIEFYSNEELPSDYTLSDLKELNSVDVSSKGDGSIIAYYDSNNNKVYIVSDNLISFNADATNMFYGMSAVTNLIFNKVDTSQTKEMDYMFYGMSGLTSLTLSNFDTSNVNTMSGMFYRCGLTELDLNNFITSNVTSMFQMFAECTNLTTLYVNSWDTSSVTSMGKMFYKCNNLTTLDVSSWDTSSVGTDTKKEGSMSHMFYGCSKLTTLDLSRWDTSNVPTMANMFMGCGGLTSLYLSGWDTRNVTSMFSMFHNCGSLTSLDLSNFDTSSVTTMQQMFYGTKKLTTLTIGCDWKTAPETTSMFTSSGYSLDKLNAIIEETQSSCPTEQTTN